MDIKERGAPQVPFGNVLLFTLDGHQLENVEYSRYNYIKYTHLMDIRSFHFRPHLIIIRLLSHFSVPAAPPALKSITHLPIKIAKCGINAIIKWETKVSYTCELLYQKKKRKASHSFLMRNIIVCWCRRINDRSGKDQQLTLEEQHTINRQLVQIEGTPSRIITFTCISVQNVCVFVYLFVP